MVLSGKLIKIEPKSDLHITYLLLGFDQYSELPPSCMYVFTVGTFPFLYYYNIPTKKTNIVIVYVKPVTDRKLNKYLNWATSFMVGR